MPRQGLTLVLGVCRSKQDSGPRLTRLAIDVFSLLFI